MRHIDQLAFPIDYLLFFTYNSLPLVHYKEDVEDKFKRSELVLDGGRVMQVGADVSWNCHDVGHCPDTEANAPRLKRVHTSGYSFSNGSVLQYAYSCLDRLIGSE